MKEDKYILTRDVTPEECPWLGDAIRKGEEVYEYIGATYGCITPKGSAFTFKAGVGPFFELPNNSVMKEESTKSPEVKESEKYLKKKFPNDHAYWNSVDYVREKHFKEYADLRVREVLEEAIKIIEKEKTPYENLFLHHNLAIERCILLLNRIKEGK